MGEAAFRGERLELARHLRKLSLTDLGKAIGYSPQYISNIEKGRREPRLELVEAFGSVLGFVPTFFLQDLVDPFRPQQCSFRKKSSTPQYEADHVLAWGTLLAELYAHLRAEVELPEVDVPNYSVESEEDAERAAEKARMYWGLGLDGPIGQMGRVIERSGIPLFFIDTPDQQIDAFARWGPTPSILANRAKGSSSRLRFDLAHETGHLIMHRAAMIPNAERERQANRFASAFLMPAAGFSHHFRTLSGKTWAHLLELKKQWKVSLGAIVRRAKDLRLIDDAEYVRRNQYIRAKGWHKGEPAEPKEEKPEVLSLALETLRAELGRPFSDIADELGWTAKTFATVIGYTTTAAGDDGDSADAGVVPISRLVL
jgi:Zn-dependent peptidase ImmA (M78 family)/DNA-binding XRE family transcriptional regulator